MTSLSSLTFIPTKSSQLKRNATENFEAVTYESHKPKAKKTTVETDVKKTKPDIKPVEINIKKARYEVIKFGMSGFDPEKKEEAKVQLAIKLGAKPPKNKCKNYKELLKERQKEREAQKRRLDFQQLGKNQQGKSTAQGKFYKPKKVKHELLDDYGKPTLKDSAKPTKSKSKGRK